MSKVILIVSEDVKAYSDLRIFLQKSGYTVICVFPDEKTVLQIPEVNPSLILIDSSLKDPYSMNELSLQIKSDKKINGIPVIAIMGNIIDDVLLGEITPESIDAKVKKYVGAVHKGASNILLIDDEKDLCESLSFRLRKNGYNVISVHNAKDGLDVIKEQNIDLVLLDLNLPGMSGEELCKRIKDDDEYGHIPVLMLTAKDSEADRVVGKVIGADIYMTKPFEYKILLKKIEELL